MHVQVNSNHIEGSARLHEWVSSVVSGQLDRFDEHLTRVEVHLTDENGQKAGSDDKRCQIEARPKGHQALSVTHKAATLDLAVDGATEKMRHALSNLFGKLESRVLSTGHLDDPLLSEEPAHVTDARIQEEFLERQQARGKE